MKLLENEDTKIARKLQYPINQIYDEEGKYKITYVWIKIFICISLIQKIRNILKDKQK